MHAFTNTKMQTKRVWSEVNHPRETSTWLVCICIHVYVDANERSAGNPIHFFLSPRNNFVQLKLCNMHNIKAYALQCNPLQREQGAEHEPCFFLCNLCNRHQHQRYYILWILLTSCPHGCSGAWPGQASVASTIFTHYSNLNSLRNRWPEKLTMVNGLVLAGDPSNWPHQCSIVSNLVHILRYESKSKCIIKTML